MNIYRHIQYLLLALIATIAVGCNEDDFIADIDGESVDVTFLPSLNSEPQSRAIGEAEGIDQVIIGVYENGSCRFSLNKTWAEAKNGVSITLIEGRTYQVLFWAQNSANTAYVLTDNGDITVNYDDYTSGGFNKMEELDAFYYVDKVTVGVSKVENRPVVLSRPFAQLNFADKATRPESGVHRAEITFANIPSSFNPLNGTITTASLSDPADDVTFNFADFTQETLTVDGVDYYYLTSNYLFAPASDFATIEATFKLQPVAGGEPIKSLEFKGSEAITLKANCKTNVLGESATGHFVGLLRGYDPNEHLTFNSNCTLTLSATAAQANDFVSPYREGNEGAWLAANDYSKYDGWLGKEECYRGTVMLGGVRFIPCWDGTTKITPLTDGSTKLIYSAFDLASLQGAAAGSIKLMENVCMEYDLDGASKDGTRNHIFKSLSTLTKLDGNGKTIYNISIRDNYYGGFVKSESCASTFENVTFDGADIRVTHDASEGNAYVGTLRGFAYEATTINNVHVKNGYLYGVCKMGGLCGGIFSKITCTNSSVTNYDIENYDSKIVSDGFKANGEIGGLIGYITMLDASTVNEISNCTVSDNNFNCVTYSATLWDRSVAPFIGDIRTQEAGSVKINNCKILGTNTLPTQAMGKLPLLINT